MEMNGIQRAAEALGGTARLAEIAGVTTSAASQWINGQRPVPAERAPMIAEASGVPIDEICPSVPWHLVQRQPHEAS